MILKVKYPLKTSRGYHASTSQKDFLKKRYNSPLLSKATSRIFSKVIMIITMNKMVQIMIFKITVLLVIKVSIISKCQ